MTIQSGQQGASRKPNSSRWIRTVGWGILIIVGVVLGGSAMSNLLISPRSDDVGRLTDLDKARISEALQLRHAIGDSIWTGWSDAKIPVIIYDEDYAFLAGISDPSAGWRTVPKDLHQGGMWEPVPADSIDDKVYYRQRLAEPGVSPQAFTVRVGDVWAASMTTKNWTITKMGNEIRDGLPAVIRYLVPYRLIARIYVGLAMNTDAYICAIEHEAFHAFQGMVVPGLLTDAEEALGRHGRSYPWDDSSFNGAWNAELNALADALAAKEKKATIELSRKFLSLRHTRRLSAGLDSASCKLEQLREWEEGLGKYTELALWKCAAADSAYRPVSGLLNDSDFGSYREFRGQWAQEMSTLRFQSHGGESRFYYSGMAQAFLLDRLLPGWRTKILRENVFLESLLNEAAVTGM